MKKSTRQFVILLAVLVVCAGAYFGIVLHKNAEARRQAEMDAASVVYIGDLEDAVHITFFNGTEELSFYQQDYTWVYEADPDFPLNTSPIRSVANAAVGLEAVKQIPITDRTDSLAAYGFNDLSPWVTVRSSSGKELTLMVGNYVNFNYYVMEPGGDAIYQIDYRIPDVLKNTLQDLLVTDSLPSLADALVQNMTFRTRDHTVSIILETYDADGTVQVMDQATGQMVDEPVTAGTYWYVVVDGVRYKATSFQMPNPDPAMKDLKSPALYYYADLQQALSDLRFERNYAYKPDAETLNALNLADPELIILEEYSDMNNVGEMVENRVILYVGDVTETEDGTFRYACLQNSDQVNLLPTAPIETILSILPRFLPAE